MISLISELTDSKGRRASRVGFVSTAVAVYALRSQADSNERSKSAFGLAALQDPRVATLLGLPTDQLLREMRVVTANNELYGGVDAIVFLARQIWWGWLIYAAAQLQVCSTFFQAGYRWFANHRIVLPICAVTKEGQHGDLTSRAKEKQDESSDCIWHRLSSDRGVVFLALLYLRSPLQLILTDLCGTVERRRFWTAFSNITLFLVPLHWPWIISRLQEDSNWSLISNTRFLVPPVVG